MKRTYRCRLCGKEFPKPHGLEIHKRIKHNGKHKAKAKAKKRPRPKARPAPKMVRRLIQDVPVAAPNHASSEALIERLRARALNLRQTADEIDSRIKVIEQTISKYLK